MMSTIDAYYYNMNDIDLFQTNAVWDWAIPLIKSALCNITVETIDDWGTFFSVISVSYRIV